MTRPRIFECRKCTDSDHACTFCDPEGIVIPTMCPGDDCDWHEVESRDVPARAR